MFRKHLIDAVGHVFWAFFAITPAILWPEVFGGALAGFLLAAPREFWDQRNPATGFTLRFGWSRALDLLGFVIGGAVAGFVFA